MFTVTCADLRTCYLFFCVSACLLEQQCVHRLEQLTFFTFKDLVLADDERYAAVIDCEHLGVGEAFAKLCFLVCQCYFSGC